MERSALRADSPALLALRAHGKTRCVRCANSARAVAVSQSTKRAARAALKPALLGAPWQRRQGAPPAAQPPERISSRTDPVSAKGCAGGGCGVSWSKRRAAQGSWPRAQRASTT